MLFDLVIPLLGIYLKDTFRRRTFINTHFFYVAKHCYNFPTIESCACWAVVFPGNGNARTKTQTYETAWYIVETLLV